MLYFTVFLLLMYLSYHYDISGKRKNYDIWYRIVLIILILIAGLRYRVGVDTTNLTYHFYHDTPSLSNIFRELSITQYPLWKLLNSFIYTIGGRWFWVQLIQAAFVNILLFKYFRKHSQHVFTCIFFYYLWLYPAINFEEMKASFAIVLSLYSYDYILDKKIVNGLLLLVAACLFHFSAILIVPFAFLTFLRLNKIGIVLLACCVLGGYLVVDYVDEILMYIDFDEFLAQKTEGYATSDRFFERDKMSLFYYVINIIPLFFYIIGSFLYVKMNNSKLPMLKLEPYLVVGLVMCGIYVAIVIFYRYINFYKVIFILFISQSFVDIAKSQFKTSRGLSYCSVILVFFFFFVNIGNSYSGRMAKFYPYSTVIDRKVYKSKEDKFNEYRLVPPPNHDEY